MAVAPQASSYTSMQRSRHGEEMQGDGTVPGAMRSIAIQLQCMTTTPGAGRLSTKRATTLAGVRRTTGSCGSTLSLSMPGTLKAAGTCKDQLHGFT